MKRILSKLLVGITVCFYLLAVMLVGAITANAGYLYDGDTLSDPKKPWTWVQGKAPWSGYPMNGVSSSSLGEAGCMIHSMTEILLKAGVKDYGYTPRDFVNDAKASGYRYGVTSQGGGYGGSLAIMAAALGKDVLVYTGQGGTMSYDEVTKRVKGGEQALFHIQNSTGIVHWIATDYVDEKGVLHLLDSGMQHADSSLTTAQKDDSRIGSQTYVSHWYKLKSGSCKTIDPKGKTGNTDEKKESAKTDTSSENKPVTEDDLTGMPDRNDYQAGSALKTPGSDIDSSTKKDVAALKEVNTNRVQDDWGKIGRYSVMLIAIFIFLYGVVIIPMCFIFDRVNTVLDFSLVRAVTFGKMETLPAGMTEDDLISKKGKPVGYLTTRGLIMRLVLCFVVSAILFSGIYQGWLINFWYWFVDFNNNGGITGDN
jgi:hypothetical protein